jgi:hypothetical protein
MAVTNGWGRGIDNSNGWGLGAYNNTISWGSEYQESWAGETLIYPATSDQAWQLITVEWENLDTTWNS